MRPLTSTQCGAKSTLYLMRDQSDLQQKIRKYSEFKHLEKIAQNYSNREKSKPVGQNPKSAWQHFPLLHGNDRLVTMYLRINLEYLK